MRVPLRDAVGEAPAVPDLRAYRVLQDGLEIVVRPVRRADAPLLARGFAALSPESRYRRFLAAKSALSEAELRHLSTIDGELHFALGVLTWDEDGHERPLAVARFVRAHPRANTAEAAVAVIDEAQGRGLGRLLLRQLARAALQRGIVTFRGEVASENPVIRRLITELDPEAQFARQSAGTHSFAMQLHHAAPRPCGHGSLH